MTEDEGREPAARAKGELASNRAANTKENEWRLKDAFARHGAILIKVRVGPTGYSLRTGDGNEISGISLLDAQDIVDKWNEPSV